MRGITDERGLSAIGDVDTSASEPGPALAVAPAGQLDGVKRTLDGVNGLGWSVVGFVLGAVFWHFVGFWSFVSEVVFAGGHQTAPDARRSAPQVVIESPLVRTADASAAMVHACVSLALDRKTGKTLSRTCDGGFVPTQGDAFSGREDRVSQADTSDTWVAPFVPEGMLSADAR